MSAATTLFLVAGCAAVPFILAALAVVAERCVVHRRRASELTVFQPRDTDPTEVGWYQVRWSDESGDHVEYRGFNGTWWTPLPDGWLSAPYGKYEWRGPVADIQGPAPDGTSPKSDGRH